MKLELKLTTKELWQFSVYHSNRGVMGLFNLGFSIAAIFLLIYKWESFPDIYRILLMVCVLMFTVWQPVILYIKARKQAKSPAVRDMMELCLDESGMTISQDGQMVALSWDQIIRAERMSSMFIFYMDRIHAYLIPKRILEDHEEAFCTLLKAQIPIERRKRI